MVGTDGLAALCTLNAGIHDLCQVFSPLDRGAIPLTAPSGYVVRSVVLPDTSVYVQGRV